MITTTVWVARRIIMRLVWMVLLITAPQMALTAPVPMGQGGAQPLSPQQRVEYVTKLGLIQGHLWVSARLVEVGHPELGAKHAKHPGQEVYQELLPFFAATKSPGFASELAAMSGQFYSGSITDFQRAYSDVMSIIGGIVDAQNLDALETVQVVGTLVGQANLEYQAGVKNGAIVDLQEYQDARGFVEIAQRLLQDAAPLPGGSGDSKGELLEQVNAVKTLWPSLNPSEGGLGDGRELASLAVTLEAMRKERWVPHAPAAKN